MLKQKTAYEIEYGLGGSERCIRDSVKRVEILRGPASSLYGSDALGGVVSYMTKDPLDLSLIHI